ncbi:MAG: gamma-glutamylcyclotransferase [Myxococcales bacterium]|nr:gamma-glutamylcyclotransferase [Myxococcales bacterium]MCB9533829.1 gamma-glutamylcyclotransferase [Myxococcales bacterium]
MDRVFVYGTLLPGLPNHGWLRGARSLGPATTERSFALYDLGHYPAAVTGGDAALRGEVFEVDAAGLARLDILEDVPALYTRALVPVVVSGSHRHVTAWVYTLAAPLPRGAVPIPDGDYAAWIRGGHGVARADPDAE